MFTQLIFLAFLTAVLSGYSITINVLDIQANRLYTIVKCPSSGCPNRIKFNNEQISTYYPNISATFYKQEDGYLKIQPKSVDSVNTIELAYPSGTNDFQKMFYTCHGLKITSISI